MADVDGVSVPAGVHVVYGDNGDGDDEYCDGDGVSVQHVVDGDGEDADDEDSNDIVKMVIMKMVMINIEMAMASVCLRAFM